MNITIFYGMDIQILDSVDICVDYLRQESLGRQGLQTSLVESGVEEANDLVTVQYRQTWK